ncbi:hypothetical protein Zm00014a_043207, partial [Zea mays]
PCVATAHNNTHYTHVNYSLKNFKIFC